jgi:hypothetical protein
MSGGNENKRDPRVRLVREKYFSIRPRPLERWLWAQGIPASAERVFWLHWQEGVQRGDWCSEIPLRRVARECSLDVSTVTRAYQLLGKMGCLRRTDPGRDAANPFQQATAVTEVRVPRELLGELDRHPNRRGGARVGEKCEEERGVAGGGARVSAGRPEDLVRGEPAAIEGSAESGAVESSREVASEEGENAPASDIEPAKSVGEADGDRPRGSAGDDSLRAAQLDQAGTDPFAGLSGRERARALAELTQAMSASERNGYQDAMRMHRTSMAFDADSKVTGEGRAVVLRVLASMAAVASGVDVQVSQSTEVVKGRRRGVSVFELARLKREIQRAGSCSGRPELLREVVWSIEVGALQRFKPLHAMNIALKKIREGGWTRPHRMPPNWMRSLGAGAGFETCGAA